MRQTSFQRIQYFSMAMVLCAGIVLSLALFVAMRQWADARLEVKFNELAQERAKALRGRMDDGVQALGSIEAFYAASVSVEPDEFQIFVKNIFEHHPEIAAIEWLPAERFNQNEAGEREVMEKARDGGNPLATVWEDFAMLVFLPIYRNGAPHETVEDRRRNLTGFVSAVFQIDQMTTLSMRGFKPAGMEFYLYDESMKEEGKALYFQEDKGGVSVIRWADRSRISGHSKLEWSTMFRVTRRNWTILFQASPEFYAAGRPWESWAALLIGLLFTTLILINLFKGLRHSIEVDQLVKSLWKTNEILHSEVEERRQVEGALEESERVLSTLISNLPGVAYRCRNEPGRPFEFVSEGIFELTGYRPADFVEKKDVRIADLIHPEDRDRVWEEIQTGVREKRPYQLVYRTRTLDWKEKWVWEKGQGVGSSSGGSLTLEGFITDISDRRKLEEQVLQAQKMEVVGRLAGGVAHDFNNLLTVIGGYVEMMLNAMAPDYPRRADLEEVKKAVASAASLTGQLLAFSRRQIINPKVINFNELILNTEKMLRRVIGEDIELVTLPGADLRPVKADQGQLEQVLLNLSVNARDAMPKGGRLTLETANVKLDDSYTKKHAGAKAGDYVMLAVSDTGHGMSEKVKKHLFEPFFTTKPKGKGTGLGLATCYGIVRQAGGIIWAYSEEGKGATLKVYLPASEETSRRPAGQDGSRPLAQGTETVLLVEDESMVRNFTARVLRQQGYTVIEGKDGEQAMRLATEHRGEIGLLFTDFVMPHMNGQELAERLKAMIPGLKVIFTSGYTDGTVVNQRIVDDSVAFIQKPFSPQALTQKIREVLEK